jgi:uncharacterized surface protein with fasciclin (FAS1) repeats
MIAYKKQSVIFLALLLGLFLPGCKDKWEEHIQIQDPVLAENLLGQISKNPDLTKFAEYLNKTGYDQVVASSKTFTIWAPTNASMQNLDPVIVNDTARLRQFVANHISNQSYFTSTPNPSLIIRTLNGKNILFTKNNFEEAKITVADRYVGNGVLHTIDMAVIPKPNGWEYLNNSASSAQKTFMQSLNYTYRDSSRAVITGIDPKTGIPILQPGSGYFSGNYFLQRTADLSNEDVKYTFVVLTDGAFSAEKAKISRYFMVNNPLATAERNAFVSDSITNWNVVKDLAFKGDYTIASLPDTLTSTDSTKIHLDKSAILETHKVSNGVVFVMNRIDYPMVRKIKPVIIEGENYVSNYGNNGTRSTITRRNPFTNTDFREIYFYNTLVASYWIKYQPTVNTVTYKVYWVAVRDFNTTAVPPAVPVMFSQRLAFGTTALLPAFPYKVVDILNYNEIYIGDYTVSSYGKLDTFLVGATTTANGTNSLVLDYIKMVPVIN